MEMKRLNVRNYGKFLILYVIFSLFLISLSLTLIYYYMSQQTITINEKKILRLSDHDDIFGEIHVLRPSESDILIIGRNFSIKWSYKGSIEYVTIALYKDYKFAETIVITTTNDGEYFWYIHEYEESNDYLIGIWDYNDFNNIDFSGFFTIASKVPFELDNNLIFIIIGSSIGITLIGITLIIVKLNRIKKALRK